MKTKLMALAAFGTLAMAGPALAKDVGGVACTTPQPVRCSGEACVPALADLGNATDAKTGRKYFLDYPCDLKPGEKVTFILNIHGAGSVGNWQRHYFPASDYVQKHRLVVATPTAATAAPIRRWSSRNRSTNTAAGSGSGPDSALRGSCPPSGSPSPARRPVRPSKRRRLSGRPRSVTAPHGRSNVRSVRCSRAPAACRPG